jgi:hypothetical protein
MATFAFILFGAGSADGSSALSAKREKQVLSETKLCAFGAVRMGRPRSQLNN